MAMVATAPMARAATTVAGNDGSNGPHGPHGNDGSNGPHGPHGNDGSNGPHGPHGGDGSNSTHGPRGTHGDGGARDNNGANGGDGGNGGGSNDSKLDAHLGRIKTVGDGATFASDAVNLYRDIRDGKDGVTIAGDSVAVGSSGSNLASDVLGGVAGRMTDAGNAAQTVARGEKLAKAADGLGIVGDVAGVGSDVFD